MGCVFLVLWAQHNRPKCCATRKSATYHFSLSLPLLLIYLLSSLISISHFSSVSSSAATSNYSNVFGECSPFSFRHTRLIVCLITSQFSILATGYFAIAAGWVGRSRCAIVRARSALSGDRLVLLRSLASHR